MTFLREGAVVPACVKRRRQMARLGGEEEGRFCSARRAAPVNLFSRFQVDSPWRIITTVDFWRAPRRRARWVARSSILELLVVDAAFTSAACCRRRFLW